MSSPARPQRGVSLVEALVAFAVLAFGLLGVVGMQSTMRSNADLARQRAEAVRLAQDAVEEWRGFSTAATTTNRMAFQDIASASPPSPRYFDGTNARYMISRWALAPTATEFTVTPAQRGILVDVAWQDRSGQPQLVRLSSAVSGVEPELGASLVLSTRTDPVLPPMGRNRAIPRSAIPLGIGRSGFVPPGQTGSGGRVAWVFDNSMAVITTCTTSANTTNQLTDTGVTIDGCSSDRAVLVSGFVRFATSFEQHSAASIRDPAGPTFREFGVGVRRTAPTPAATFGCFQDARIDNAVAYYCAVALTTNVKVWSGYIEFEDPPFPNPPLPIASSAADASPLAFKICRYHANAAYTDVSAALVNQNFVIIRAGLFGAYRCPDDGTPRSTWPHQPAT